MLETGRGPRLATHQPVGFDPALRTRRSQRLRRVLGRRRRLRIGLVQAIFVAAAPAG